MTNLLKLKLSSRIHNLKIEASQDHVSGGLAGRCQLEAENSIRRSELFKVIALIEIIERMEGDERSGKA